MLRIVALVALILALFAVSGCVSGTGGTADQTATEVQRWHDSIVYWQEKAKVIEAQLNNPPPNIDLLNDKTRKYLTDALATANWFIDLYVGLTNKAATQTVPIVAPAK
jgi:outer membrane murein-binding lipoprotein Lpp